MGQMSLLFAMGLFIMASVNCFGKKPVLVGKYITIVLIELLESQYETILKFSEFSIITDFFH